MEDIVISQNQINHSPWAKVIVLVIAIILLTGLLLGNRELFSPKRAEQSASSTAFFDNLAYRSTQAVVDATSQAIRDEQNLQIMQAQYTALPLQNALTIMQHTATLQILQQNNTATQQVIQQNHYATQTTLPLQATQIAMNIMEAHAQANYWLQETQTANTIASVKAQGDYDLVEEWVILVVIVLVAIGLTICLSGIGVKILLHSLSSKEDIRTTIILHGVDWTRDEPLKKESIPIRLPMQKDSNRRIQRKQLPRSNRSTVERELTSDRRS